MTVSPLRLRAPSKINWTLEVLGKRPDGYHEVRTILQTIELSDGVVLTPADHIAIKIGGRAALASNVPTGTNLAIRAARRVIEQAGSQEGVRIVLEKRIPVGAGLGGGSSDAAAVLRGLPVVLQLEMSEADLLLIAASLGADVPFFLTGGVALAKGRGEEISALPDSPGQRLVIASPPAQGQEDKTARMYAALRAEHFSDGSSTISLADRLRAGEALRDEDIFNVFEAVLPVVDPQAARAFDAARDIGQPHLCGSGPSFFFLLQSPASARPVLEAIRRLGLWAVATRTLPRLEAVEVKRAG